MKKSVTLWCREHLSARWSVWCSKIYSLKEWLSVSEHCGRWHEEQYNVLLQESSTQPCTSWISSSKKIFIQFALTSFQTGSNEENDRHNGAAPEVVKHQDTCSRIYASGPAFHTHNQNYPSWECICNLFFFKKITDKPWWLFLVICSKIKFEENMEQK